MPDPEKIGKYTVIEKIGRGGMGYVYRAHDPILKRDVALKTMLKDVSEDTDLRNRFIREAQSAGGLRHPNIVTIYDLGETEDGCPYIAMEFLTGTDLEHVVKNKIDLSLSKKLEIIIQTCQGLAFAHANGIVHRDIKAGNIRLLDNGEVKIMDFGIAKISASHFTRTGMIMGTPHYMAPEQIRGEKVDGRADIFSVGVVLYELLVFRKPFPGDNPTTVLFKIIHENPEPLIDAEFVPPEGLEEVVARALAKKPEDRYQTCEEMAEDLRHIYYLADTSENRTSLFSQTPLPQRFQPTGRTPVAGTPLPSKAKATTLETTGSSTRPAENVPTVLQPVTQATKAQYSESSTYTPTTATSHLPPVAIEKRKQWWLAAIGVTVLLVVAAVIALLNLGPDKPSTISVKRETPVSTPTVQPAGGWVEFNIQPWAMITDLTDSRGRSINPPFNMTPCRMRLEQGKYHVTLSNKSYETMSLEFDVKANEITVIKKQMQGFKTDEALESLGLL